jgi:hypothetical protein
MSDDPKRIVEHGYNAIADRYAEWARTEVTGSPAVDYLERLLALLPPGADVLELGCGNGDTRSSARTRVSTARRASSGFWRGVPSPDRRRVPHRDDDRDR